MWRMEAGLWVCCARPQRGSFGERVKSLRLLVSVLLEPWERWLWIPVENLVSGPEAQGPLLWRLCSEEPFSFLPVAAWSLGALPAGGADPAVSLMEDPPQRLRWQAHLEFTHNHDVGDLTWDKIAVSLPRSDKLRSLVLAGIPHSMRPQVRLGGGPAEGDRGLRCQQRLSAYGLLPSAVDAAVWGPAEKEKLRTVLPGDSEEQLQRRHHCCQTGEAWWHSCPRGPQAAWVTRAPLWVSPW